jgi:hypothetical protein
VELGLEGPGKGVGHMVCLTWNPLSSFSLGISLASSRESSCLLHHGEHSDPLTSVTEPLLPETPASAQPRFCLAPPVRRRHWSPRSGAISMA